MILTEEKAMKKFCRAPGGGKCCASDCMMWRWSLENFGEGPIREVRSDNFPEPVPGHIWRIGKTTDRATTYGLFRRVGYCGLGGIADPRSYGVS